MLQIRSEQVEALRQAARGRFAESMCEHVRAYFPNHCRMAGEAAVRATVDHGIDRAAHYGMDTERDVCLYITTMCMLGSHFDTDPMFPWAAYILNDVDDPDPRSRADRLADRALEFQKRIAGTDNRAMNRTFLALRRDFPQIVAEPRGGDLDAHLRVLLPRVFARKADEVGDAGLEELIALGRRNASDYGLPGGGSQVLYVLLSFLMGSHFDRDPMVPWAARVLRDESVSPADKAEQLIADSEAYLKRWLDTATADRRSNAGGASVAST